MEKTTKEVKEGVAAYLDGIFVGLGSNAAHALAIAEAAEDHWKKYRNLRGFDPESVAAPHSP